MKNSWIQTYTGKKIFPLIPNKDEIDIIDIANSLGKICRYNGHTLKFYSVAEHSVYISQNVSKKNAMWGLMHDAAEAYLGDIPSPIKRHLNDFKQYEENLLKCIADKFNLYWPIPKEVKEIDRLILHDESNQIMESKPQSWSQITSLPLGIKIFGLDWQQAIELFLVRYDWIK